MAVKFDPTINLGHVLTFTGFLATGVIAYGALEKRVSLLEERTEATVRLADDRARDVKDTLREIKTDVKELRREWATTPASRSDRK